MATDLKTLTPGTAAASSVVVGAASTASASPSLFTTTGSGNVVLSTSPTLVTPALGTPSALTLTNATGLPVSTGLSGAGTGVLTALGNATNAASGLVALDANQSLSITGATVTTSQPVLNLSQTWNDGGSGTVTFTGLKFNATSLSSASGSLLLDLQTGAASVFNVTKTGGFTFTDASTTTGSTSWNFYASNLSAPGSATLTIGKNTNARANVLWDSLATTATLSAYNSGTTAHVTLLAGGTGGLVYLRPGSSGATQLGAADAAAPVAQTLQVQSVVAGTSNTAGANWTLKGSAGTGTGAGGSIIFQVAPAGTTGTAQNAYATALTINQANSASGVGVVQIGGGGNSIPQLTFLPNSGNSCAIGMANSGGALNFFGAGSTPYIAITPDLVLSGGRTLGWSTTDGNPNTTVDVKVVRDAANTLALRNGATAQTYRIYATTDSPVTNFQRLTLSAGVTANMAIVAADNGGTGIAMGLQFGAALTTGGGVTNIMNINTSGHLVWNTDNTYDIGASGATRPRYVYAGTRVDAPTLRTATAYTVATLPAAGTAGRRAYVTDATAPTFLGTLTGGGAVVTPVFDNGTAWVAG